MALRAAPMNMLAAEAAARHLKANYDVQNIYLFGRATSPRHRIDLIATSTTDEYWHQFAANLLRYRLAGDTGSKWQQKCAKKILLGNLYYPHELEDIVFYTSPAPSPRLGAISINLLPLPNDWRDRVGEIQKSLRCLNPNFVQELANTAQLWDIIGERFLPQDLSKTTP